MWDYAQIDAAVREIQRNQLRRQTADVRVLNMRRMVNLVLMFVLAPFVVSNLHHRHGKALPNGEARATITEPHTWYGVCFCGERLRHREFSSRCSRLGPAVRASFKTWRASVHMSMLSAI